MRVHKRSISTFLPIASVFCLGITRSTMSFHQKISPIIIQRCCQMTLQMKPGMQVINRNHINVTDNNSSNDNAPVCRIVATSDGKISSSALALLSRSSKSLLHKIELIYAVESQKRLRDLTHTKPQSTIEVMNNEMQQVMDGMCVHEDRLVSILKQALEDGGYKLMSQRDLDLCSALNAGYLLRLSLLPDLKDFDPCVGREFYPEMYKPLFDDTGTKYGSIPSTNTTPITNKLLFDGKVLVFRRGYSKEITNGRLLLPKLDYLQASLVQRSSSALTRKFGVFEQCFENFFRRFISDFNHSVQRAYDRLLRQFQEPLLGVFRHLGLPVNSYDSAIEYYGENQTDVKATASLSSSGTRRNKVFKFSRYQASSTTIANSLDDALSPFLLRDIIDNTTHPSQEDTNGWIKNGKVLCQYDDEIASEEIESASSFSLLERISIQNTVDFFTTNGRKELVRNFFKSSTLVEPAFEEVIVISKPTRKMKLKSFDLYPPKWLYEAAKVFDVEDQLPSPKNMTKDNSPDVPIPIDIKVFSDVPMANIEAVMPKAKLVFRPADAVVFDLVSVVSFVAIAGSLRFDSPKLDLIAVISLTVFVVQTFFRYSNKYARYDIVVNKFITSKVMHRGPGALKYIVSESERNRALRAVLTRDWLIKNAQDIQLDAIDDAAIGKAKSYMNTMISTGGSQIDIDVRSALDDLKDLQLINNTEVKDEPAASDVIKNRWNSILGELFYSGNCIFSQYQLKMSTPELF